MTEPHALPPVEEPEELERMSLFEHLEELRRRILISLAAIVVGFFVCFAFAEEIYAFLARPITPHVEALAFSTVTSPFLVYVKVAALASVFLTSPIILWQVWGFIAPGLYRHEKSYALPFVFFGSSFFLAGGVFGYVIAFPYAVEFLLGMGEQFQPVIMVDSYLSFLITILLGLGMMFELPILIFMLSQLGVVSPRFLMRHFRWAVLIIFIVAAIITPTPDPVNLCVVAVPTILLYLLGVGASALARRGKSDG